MEILPEEVALKYGYAADQRVVNIVLRQRFNSTSAEARARAATDGGYRRRPVRRDQIAHPQRPAHLAQPPPRRQRLDHRSRARHRPRRAGRPPDPRDQRTLVGQARNARVYRHRQPHDPRRCRRDAHRRGRPLDRPQPLRPRQRSTFDPLDRTSTQRQRRARPRAQHHARQVAPVVDRQCRTSSTAITRLRPRPRAVRRPLALRQPHASSSTPPPTARLLALPAGDATATFKLAAGAHRPRQPRDAAPDIVTETDLGRTSGEGSVSLDLPILDRGAKLGRLTANANAARAPPQRFRNADRARRRPQLGPRAAPQLHRQLDAARKARRRSSNSAIRCSKPPTCASSTRSTARRSPVTTLTGGNPDLDADKRRVFKLGANWQPVEKLDLRLRADYVRSDHRPPAGELPRGERGARSRFPRPLRPRCRRHAGPRRPAPGQFRIGRAATRCAGASTSPSRSQSTPPSAAAIAALRERFAPAGRQAPPAHAGAGGETPAREGAQDGQRGGMRFGGPGGRRRRTLRRRPQRRAPDPVGDPHHQPRATA